MADRPDPAELESLAVAIAEEAARVAQRQRGEHLGIDTKSSPTDLVTTADRATEALIVDRLRAARPDDGLNGEEGAAQAGTSGVRWHIDPIDGTTNFVYGIPGYAVSIAAELDGEVVAGAVADPSRAETFSATKGGGARRNGATIRCRTTTDLSQALVATGFSYLPERRAVQAEILAALLPHIRDIRRLGAASTDLCALACGRVDAYYEHGLRIWDYAAGALVAAEAGAHIGDLNGDTPSEHLVIGATPALFESLRSRLEQAGAANL